MTHNLTRVSEFLLELYRLAQTSEPEVFQTETLRLLQSLVPFDFAAWGDARAGEREVTQVTVVGQAPELLTGWGSVAHLDRFCDLTLQRINRTWTFDDVGKYRASTAYNEHWRTFDVNHMMSTIVTEPIDDHVSFVGLCNEDKASPFSEENRQLKQIIMPHLAEALRLNRKHLLDSAIASDDDGVAIVDNSGLILLSSGAFHKLIDYEWNRQTVIPQQALSAIREKGCWAGHSIQLRAMEVGSHMLVRAQLASPVDCLSVREAQVAELFAAGRSYKQVAQALGIAPATVRNFITRIYSKLAVSSKAELVRLLR